MSVFSVGEQELFCEQTSRADAETRFVLRIEYERGSTAGVDRIELDADSRMAVTEEVVVDAIQKWDSESVREFVRSFDVYERTECRSGGPTEESRERWMIGSPGTDEDDGTSGGEVEAIENPVGFSAGDRVAYYVQGPESSVYGYVAEARVEKAPPWMKGSPGRADRIVNQAVLERGDDTKEIPLEWIIGTTDDDDVAAQVDRPYQDG